MARRIRLVTLAVLLGATSLALSGCFLDSNGDQPNGAGGGFVGTSASSSGAGPNMACTTASNCDDKSACTVDSCQLGTCVHTQMIDDGNECTTDTCGAGVVSHTVTPGSPCGKTGALKCNAQGKCTGCTTAADCPVSNACQTYSCDASKVCQSTDAPAGMPLPDGTAGECKTAHCDGAGMTAAVPKPGGTACTMGGHVCDGGGQCVACLVSLDCAPVAMTTPNCDAPTHTCVSCFDGKANGVETDKDCGGPECAARCANGFGCATGTDCVNGVCASGKCQPCFIGANCQSKVCKAGQCQAATCSDGVQNQGEKGIDCGGPCGKCDGDSCAAGAECASTSCALGVCCNTPCDKSCQACALAGHAGQCSQLPAGLNDAVCSDAANACSINGNCKATGAKKKDGGTCATDADCVSGACGIGKVCRFQNGDICNDDVSCASNACINYVCVACSGNNQCAGGTCASGVCTVANSKPCGVNADCAGGKCQYGLCKLDNGASCSDALECVGGRCIAGKCAGCSVNTDCPSQVCTFGSCLLPVSAYCAGAQECASGTCAGYPSICK